MLTVLLDKYLQLHIHTGLYDTENLKCLIACIIAKCQRNYRPAVMC